MMAKGSSARFVLNLTLLLLLTGWVDANAQTLLVRGGTLIDGTGTPPVPNARILITDGIIKQVWSGDAGIPVPGNATVVDATGKFIIPGLIDSHVHYAWYEGELFLAHGVTSVFDLGGGRWSESLQNAINAGQVRAPRYFFKASLGDGGNGKTDPLAGSDTAKTRMPANVVVPADATKAVAALKGKADIITLGEEWKGDYFKAVSSAAHVEGLSIISHSFNALETSDWGVDGIEHLTGIGMAAVRSPEGKKALAEMGFCEYAHPPIQEQSLNCIAAGHKNSLLYRWMDTTYFDEMIQRLLKNGTVLNPTLAFEWGGIIDRSRQFELEDQKLLSNPGLQYVPYDERLVFLDQYHWADKRSPEDKVEFQKGYKKVQEFLQKFVAAGGRLYSGTDTASAIVPGLSLHHEMQLYVDAGIPPMKALQASTLWPAQMARKDKTLGSIEPGKHGDLVILATDPLADIHNTQSVEQVVIGGVIQDIGFHSSYDVPIHTWGPVGKHLYSLPPVVSNLIPGSAAKGSDTWIQVTGLNFSPNSVVLFDGSPVETKWVSDKEMSARLTPKQTSQWGAYLIGVSTPKPGGGVTEGLGFVVTYK
jgi:Amidohydrolase family/IPT/TIG domain